MKVMKKGVSLTLLGVLVISVFVFSFNVSAQRSPDLFLNKGKELSAGYTNVSACRHAQDISTSETTCQLCDNRTDYPIMRLDWETLQEWEDLYNSASRAYRDPELVLPSRGSFSLLDHLDYTPSERNQGKCGNCWVWAGTGIMEVALDVQEGIKDRLSVQYFTSGWHGGTAGDWAGCGGNLYWFADWYDCKGFAIPWSNTNAYWQDGNRTCEDGTSVPFDTISTSPSYPLSYCAAESIETHGVGQVQAIDNIKNVLHQDKAVSFDFALPNTEDWDVFGGFWWYEQESAIWNPDYSYGHTWVDGEGAGHAVLCVGYDDTDPNNSYWIMVNSWGTADGGRPNGIFHVDMNLNYDCAVKQDDTYIPNLYWETLDVAFVHSEELRYDDGTPEQGWYWKVSGGMFAVSFTPRVAGQLTECSFYILNPAEVKVHVMDASKRDIITPFSVTPKFSGWAHVYFLFRPAVSSGVDFYIGIEWTVANKPSLGDDTSDPDGRSWDYIGGEWSRYTDGDYLIRAEVETVRKTELHYDDGTWENAWCWTGAGCMFAVVFTPRVAGRLTECNFFIARDPARIKVHVGRAGGAWLITPFSVTPTSTGWCHVDLSAYKIAVSPDFDFVIAIEWTVANKPSLGDDTSDPDGRSWDYIGGEWSRYTDGDYLIRAVVETEAPDLIVSDIVWGPIYPVEGNTVTFTVYITNQGAGDAGSFKVAYYVDDVKKGEWSIYSLSTGQTTSKTFTWTAVEGTHTVKAFADSNGVIAEIVKTNNKREETFQVSPKPKPDLIVSDISWTPEKPVEEGTVTFTVTIKNNGTVNAGSFKVSYYIDGTKLGEWSITSLLAGQNTNKTFTWTAVYGTHRVKAFADSSYSIDENVEGNNEREETFQVSPKPKPDLIISNISWSPVAFVEGETVTFNVTIKNQGTVNAGSFKVAYYIDEVKEGEWSMTSLSAGGEVSKTFTWTAVKGSHTVKAFADSNNDIIEGDETNNEREVLVGNQPPVASFSYSAPYKKKPTTFNASDSHDPDGTIISYIWDFGDGNVTTTTNPIVIHVYAIVGNYTVILNVTDSQSLWNTATATVTVKLMGDLNDDCVVNILDVSIGARAYGTRPGDKYWNPIADVERDGVINILDVSKVAREYGQTCQA
jgi:hypothetical protein